MADPIWLSLAVLFALARVAITIVIIFYTIRIPFKRTYHWMFLVVSLVMLWWSAGYVYAFMATDAATALARASSPYSYVWAHTRVQSLVIYQFVLYFVSTRMSRWQKGILLAGYGYVVATVWVPLLIDPTFILTLPVKTVIGWTMGPGSSDPYLRPYGVDIFTTLMAVLIFGLLIRYYRLQKSPLVRGQIIYLIIGILFIFAGAYANYISRFLAAPDPINLLAGAGDFVLLLGLKKRGFYSVTPVVETELHSVATYSLEAGHSYRIFDKEDSFLVFLGLMKNGYEGLCIARTYPEDIRKTFGLRTTPIRWLAEEEGEGVISPRDLLGLSLTIKDFLNRASHPVVMLQGIDYLITMNGFNPILRLLRNLNSVVSERGGILIIPQVPNVFTEDEQRLLNQVTRRLPSAQG